MCIANVDFKKILHNQNIVVIVYLMYYNNQIYRII